MMKSTILSLLLASASAFAPAAQVSDSIVVEKELPVVCRWKQDSRSICRLAWRRRQLVAALRTHVNCSSSPFYLSLLFLTPIDCPTGWICFLECRGNVQIHPLLGPPRKVGWIHAWRHGIRPNETFRYSN